jgi:hypothetical protein
LLFRFAVRIDSMPQLLKLLNPVTTTTTQSASGKWALSRNNVQFARFNVCARKWSGGYVSLEGGYASLSVEHWGCWDSHDRLTLTCTRHGRAVRVCVRVRCYGILNMGIDYIYKLDSL